MTDEELVRRMQRGDMQAFDELYERYKNDAYRVACLITGTRADGEDLTQEAFMTCAQSITSLKDGSKFRPWLLKTLTRAAWKYCRKKRRETPVSEFFETGESESALSAVLRTDEQRRLYAALDTLDEKRRTVIVLYYFDDRSVKEIAQATGVLEGTVKSRLFSARRHLRQALTDKEQKPKEAATHG
ncbi:MAG: RNA polymerase sigma factor [Eubacteriales bacterium]|nr:RNA polymerase sigma factor [Eubacteriales bacterium]